MSRFRNTFLQNAKWRERERSMKPKTISKIGGIIFLAAIAGSVMAGVMTWIQP